MKKRSLSLFALCLLALSCQSFGMDSLGSRYLLLPSDLTPPKIEPGTITSEGLQLDLNAIEPLSGKPFSEIISNPNGVCLAFDPIDRMMYDALNSKFCTHRRHVYQNVCLSGAHNVLYLRSRPTDNFVNLEFFDDGLVVKLIELALKEEDSIYCFGSVADYLFNKNSSAATQAALLLYKRAVDQHENGNSAAYYGQGRCYERQRKYREAIECYEKAKTLGLRFEGYDKAALETLAAIHDKEKMVEEKKISCGYISPEYLH